MAILVQGMILEDGAQREISHASRDAGFDAEDQSTVLASTRAGSDAGGPFSAGSIEVCPIAPSLTRLKTEILLLAEQHTLRLACQGFALEPLEDFQYR
eukprot:4072227-Amphidinium_carterae.1